MQIGNKLFPYPTINNSQWISGFKDGGYSLKYECNITEENLILENLHIEVEEPIIINLLERELAEALVIVESSNTIYREKYKVSRENSSINIPLSNLKDKVVISSYIYAKENIENYLSENFLDEYEGFKFQIEKYCILAIDDGSSIKIDRDESKDKKLSSIFSVIKDTSSQSEEMQVDIRDKRIIIYLPEKTFNYYDTMKKEESFKNIFFSILAIPALTYAIQKIQKEYKELDAIEMQYSWVIAIEKAYKKVFGKELTEENFFEWDIACSQKILNNGTVNALEELFNFSNDGTTREEDSIYE